VWEQKLEAPVDNLLRVGKTRSPPFRTKDSVDSELSIKPKASAELSATGIQLGEWCKPAKGPKAEEESMRVQAKSVKRIAPIPESELNEAIAVVCRLYPQTSVTLQQCVSISNIQAALSAVNLDASPGYPYGKLFNTNKDLLANPAASCAVVQAALWRVEQLSKVELSESELFDDPSLAINRGWCDPMRVFVKDEPHSMKKRQQRRWRLINSLSITDQIVERLLFSTQDSAEIAVWEHIPSKSGMGLDDESVSKLLRYADANNLNLSTDVENWDWRAPDQFIRAEAKCRVLLNQARDVSWERCVLNWYVLHSHRVLMLSNGTCFKRTILGGQASGRKVTSSSNGRARCLLEAVVAARLGYEPAFMTQGDDAVTYCPEGKADAVIRMYSELFDITLTDAIHRKDCGVVNFCSQTMTRDPLSCVPERPQKQLAKFLASTSTDKASALESMRTNLRHHPDLAKYVRVAVAAE
jgi:hypothetical protein